jgi:predicted DNA-binding protein (UPF0251 family)/predicted transcriptional regulator
MTQKHTGIKKMILKELAKNKTGLTNFELSEKLGLTKMQVNDSLRESVANNYVHKGENLGAEGINYTISNAGLAYLKNSVEKSPLAQNEKTVVETVEAAPIVEESVLEQIEKTGVEAIEAVAMPLTDSEVAEIEKRVIKESLTTEIEGFETRAPFSAEEIAAFPVTTKIKVNVENKLWQIIDEAAEKFAKLLAENKAKPIENIEYKIATLESLADIYNPKISATLREIVLDLRG